MYMFYVFFFRNSFNKLKKGRKQNSKYKKKQVLNVQNYIVLHSYTVFKETKVGCNQNITKNVAKKILSLSRR